jgi:hypothetical protein
MTTADTTAVIQDMPPIADPDDEALRLAEEEEAKELAANGGTVVPPAGAEPAAGTPPAAVVAPGAAPAPAAAPAAPAAGQPNRMVPVAVAVALRREKQEAERRVDYAQGKIEALEAMVRNGAASPPAAVAARPQPVDQIRMERAKISAAAKRFDAGEITADQLEEVRGAADDTIANIRSQQQLAAFKAAQPAPVVAPQEPSLADEQVLASQLDQLATRFSFAGADSPIEDHQWALLGRLAAEHLVAEGVDPKSIVGNRGTAMLRAKASELSEIYGPSWYPNWKPAAAATAVAVVPQPGAAPALTPRQQQTQAKLDLAASMPPDTTTMGAQAPTTPGFTDAQIEAMPSAELEKLIAKNDPRLAAFGLT